MGRNIGALDQALRLFIGTALALMWVFGPIGPWGVLGIYPLLTGITGACPVYALLGFSTARPTPNG